jgi:hypothetical protein
VEHVSTTDTNPPDPRQRRVPLSLLEEPIPPRLFRFFKESDRHFAERFLNGEIYVSTLANCRCSEDQARADRGEAIHVLHSGRFVRSSSDPAVREGMARMGFDVSPGLNLHVWDNIAVDAIDDALVLCFTLEASEHALRRFGPFGVEVTRPRDFLEILTTLIYHNVQGRQMWALMGKVRYAERGFTIDEPDPGPVGFVKPPSFAADREYRMLWRFREPLSLQPGAVSSPQFAPLLRKANSW